jgi:hypothetical protein
MLKKENSIIFTCSEDESYFSFITFTTNKRVLFSVFAKELAFVLMLWLALFFGIFCFCVCLSLLTNANNSYNCKICSWNGLLTIKNHYFVTNCTKYIIFKLCSGINRLHRFLKSPVFLTLVTHTLVVHKWFIS